MKINYYEMHEIRNLYKKQENETKPFVVQTQVFTFLLAIFISQ